MTKRTPTFENCCTRIDFAAAIACAVGRAMLRGHKQEVWRYGKLWVIQDA